MKKIVSILVSFLFCSTLFAKSPLPELEQKMWNYLLATQVQDNQTIRTKGGWPSYSRFKGTNIHSQESNSFVTSQLLVALSNVEKDYIFPHFEESSKSANEFLDLFIADTIQTNEAPGTIAYWPLLKTPGGKWIRSFSTALPYRLFKAFNIPNDLDASANYFMWLHSNQHHLDYQHSFAKVAGLYLDDGRKVFYPKDKIWKKKNSGAFLTWVDDDLVNNPKSRIFKGINDVDCVVNLNILTALLTYQNNKNGLSVESQKGLEASCRLINETVFSKQTNNCGVWYDRASQFYTAYAKTYSAQENSDCLNPSLEAAKEDILKKAQLAVYSKNITEMAEYTSAIKKLWSPDKRPKEVVLVLKQLEERLRSAVIVKNQYAFYRSADSLFVAKLGSILTVEWYSPQFTTAMALEALLIR